MADFRGRKYSKAIGTYSTEAGFVADGGRAGVYDLRKLSDLPVGTGLRLDKNFGIPYAIQYKKS